MIFAHGFSCQHDIKNEVIRRIFEAIDHTFHGFTSVITHAGCWENTRKACKSRVTGTNTRGVLLGILGGGVAPGSPNPDPISGQKVSLSTPVFRPDL